MFLLRSLIGLLLTFRFRDDTPRFRRSEKNTVLNDLEQRGVKVQAEAKRLGMLPPAIAELPPGVTTQTSIESLNVESSRLPMPESNQEGGGELLRRLDGPYVEYDR